MVWALLESSNSPTKEPVASSAGLPQTKQPTGRELSPTHQQVSILSFTELCPPEQHPALPTTSPSHQEACTSLLDSLIHQRTDGRSKKNYIPAACGTKTTLVERQTKWKGRRLCTRWRNKIKRRKKTKWREDRQPQPSRKRIQYNDSENDPGPRKKNGGKDQEDARNV